MASHPLDYPGSCSFRATACFFAILAALHLAPAETTLRLAPGGPIATPAAARDAARHAEKPARIVVAQGTYALTEALALTKEDSQTTWEAEAGAKPVFSGGQSIAGWQETNDGLWRTELSEVQAGRWYFQQLWVNGRRAQRARTPNRGFLRMTANATSEDFPAGSQPAAEHERDLSFHAFSTNAEGFAPFSRVSSAEASDVTVIIPHTWEVHQYKLKALEAASCSVLLRGPSLWELLRHEPDGRFYMENFLAALDEPGEWFLSRSGALFYKPRPGETLANTTFMAPVADRLLALSGVDDITFRGISFQHQNWVCGPEGHGDGQAAASIGGAIEAEHSRNVLFDQCEVAHVAGYGVWLSNGCRQVRVQNSHLHDLGAGGVKIGFLGHNPVLPKDSAGFCTVDNCIIQHGGRIFPGAVAVIVGNCGDNVITHNDIGDFYYTAVSLGWVWGYNESRGMNNRVENNHLHHLGWGFTSDMGGLYNLGVSLGTVVRGNHIHDVASYRYGGWGLYTDEGSTGVLLENNLVHDTSESSFHQHYGFYNTVRNNILAFGGKAQIQRTRPETRLSFIFENNIVLWDPATKFLDGTKYNWEYPANRVNGDGDVTYLMRNNVYWPLGKTMPAKIAEHWTWEEWQKSGRDAGSQVTDPLFKSIEKRDFRLREGSPAAKTGFVAWDLSRAGVRADGPQGPAWRELAALGAVYPHWKNDSKPWPAPLFGVDLQSFEKMPVGTCRLPGQHLHVENKGDSIAVTEDAASPIPLVSPAANPVSPRSPRSLKLQDAAGLQFNYSPHLAFAPNWEKGMMKVSFDVMARADNPWQMQMRDGNTSPYLTGVSLQWKDGKLSAGEGAAFQNVLDVAAGQWVRVEMEAMPGSSHWQLNLTREDGQKARFESLPAPADWTKCQYLVWISLGGNEYRHVPGQFEPAVRINAAVTQTGVSMLPSMLWAHTQNHIKFGGEFASLGAGQRLKCRRNQFALLGVAHTVEDAVPLIARLTLDITLGGQPLWSLACTAM